MTKETKDFKDREDFRGRWEKKDSKGSLRLSGDYRRDKKENPEETELEDRPEHPEDRDRWVFRDRKETRDQG